MSQQRTRKRQDRQYSATTRTQTSVARGLLQLKELSLRLSEELLELQRLHLSCRVLFQKYSVGLDCTFYSQEVRRLTKAMQSKSCSQTVAKNMWKKIEVLNKHGLLPEMLPFDTEKKVDLFLAHFPHEAIAGFAQLSKTNSTELSDDKRRAVISYLKLLRSVLQTPERYFARSVKKLRNHDRVIRRQIGAEKADLVLKEIWQQNGLDWEALKQDKYDELQKKIEDAFKNEK